MGYDMYIVQDRDQAEADAIAAARAHINTLAKPWDLPGGSPEQETAQKAWDEAWRALAVADRSYFRLNVRGMSRCCNLMAELGMLTTQEAPAFPRTREFGLEDWPEDPDEPKNDAERSFLAACEAVCAFEPQPVLGIPVGKFGTNDGWLVTPAQIAAALEAHRDAPEAHKQPLVGDIEWWPDWIAFLEYAQGRGGFRVH